MHSTAHITRTVTTGPNVVEVDARTWPAWVHELLRQAEPGITTTAGGLEIRATEAPGLSHTEVVLPGAIDLDSREFQRRVTDVYAVIRERLSKSPARHPLRFWNFVPGIHRPAHDGMVWYEAFNAGRFAAFTDWYATPRFGPRMIAASGLDHRGPDFVVQVLASERPGRGLENPRQRAAYRYSRRYGPLPPCFARATVATPPLADRELVIVAGTASVVGEDSFHAGDLDKQVEETCLNLRSLIHVAIGNGLRPDPLERFQELRAYVVDDSRRDAIVDLFARRLPNLEHLELMPADLCRPELLVEVEGVVRLDG